MPGVVTAAGAVGVVQMGEGKNRVNVVANGGVVQIDPPGFVHEGIFEHGAEAFGAVVDVALVVGVVSRHPGVAAALQIEDAVFAPPMKRIADQGPVDVDGERGFAGAPAAEKERDIAFGSRVGRAQQWEHIFVGQQVVHDGKDAGAHFAGIAGAPDNRDFFEEVHHRKGFAIHPIEFRDRFKAWDVNDGVFGEVRFQLPRFGFEKHVAGEEAVPGGFGNHPNGKAKTRIGAAVAILNEQGFVLQVV